MMRQLRFPTTSLRVAAIGLIAVAAMMLGLWSGIGLAQVLAPQDQPPAGLASTQRGTPALPASPAYPVNAAGQTYGAPDGSVLPDEWPDLILVEASNGALGYVEKSVLDEVTGANVSSPDEAVEWQKRMEAATWETKQIHVDQSDGVIRVGSFVVSRSQGADLPLRD